MRTETRNVRIGENMGPVDWTHETARDMPAIWREAEQNPDGFTFSEYGRTIINICMYDGWPYWTPRPAVCFIGPLNTAEWAFFDSYVVGKDSIRRKAQAIEARRVETGTGSVEDESAVPTGCAQGTSHE